MWLNVDKEGLDGFHYEELGMETRAEVTDNRKVQVSESVGNALLEAYPGDFSEASTEEEDDSETFDTDYVEDTS